MTISKELFLKCADGLNFTITEENLAQFDRYAQLLIQYNEKVNLTAITAPDEIVVKHFIDSLYLFHFVQPDENAKICDVGTGAGFPGVCLAITRPDLHVTLFDSVNKKLDFIRFLSKELGICPEILHVRAEDAGQSPLYREKFDLATARAVASLNKLSEYCIPFVKPGGVFAPLKAVLSEEEENEGIGAAKKLGCRLKEKTIYDLPTGERREVLIFEKTGATPPKFPRNPALISKSPLK